jgi:hypothetical protein
MAIVLDGTAGITTPDLTDTSLTSGRVVYAGTSGNLTGSANLTFDAANNLGIGTASPTASSSNRTLTLNSPATFGSLIDFKTNETLNLRIFSGVTNSVLSVKTSTYLSFETLDTERMRIPAAGGVQAVSIISVGNATPASTGAGITFPASRSASTDANTLDDFEEGTWTPTCVSSSGTITTVGTVGGTYQIVGSRINAQGFANITTNGTGSGVIILGGLPTNPSTNVVGYGTETSVTYKALAVLKYTTSALNIAFYDHTYPGANSALLSVGYIDTAVF